MKVKAGAGNRNDSEQVPDARAEVQGGPMLLKDVGGGAKMGP